MIALNSNPQATASEHYILFERIPLIYARVPKVANSSVKAALTRLLEQPPEEGYRTTADAMWRRGTHGETRMIDAQAARERRSSHFIFSFVRNPFDRLVSAYNNKLVENDHLSTAMQKMGLERYMPFERFLEVLVDTDDADLDVHLLPQSAILCLEGVCVPRFVGRMEAMADHWQLLRRRMRQAGLPALGKLPTKNVRRSDHSDLSGHFSHPHRVDLVLRRYRQDVELFYGDQNLERLAAGELSSFSPPLESHFQVMQP
ncbi:MAG: sulfotransferase family protein [Chitinophagaceae bacterium]|nr:sulfotransferase family protein [Chitinophagaceae bacterium]